MRSQMNEKDTSNVVGKNVEALQNLQFEISK
jgi:hypothetical protein